MRPSSQMRRRSPCKREKTRLDSVGRAPNSITPRPVDPALRLRTATTDVRFINEVPISKGRSSTAEPRPPKPMMGMQLPPPLPLTRGVTAAQRSLKPSGLGSSPSGSTSFQIIPRWPTRQGSALLMRSIVVRIHFAEPVSSRDENATDGAFRFRRRRPVCEAAVRRRMRWLQGLDIQGVAQLEECRRRKPEAAGSYPATLTNN